MFRRQYAVHMLQRSRLAARCRCCDELVFYIQKSAKKGLKCVKVNVGAAC